MNVTEKSMNNWERETTWKIPFLSNFATVSPTVQSTNVPNLTRGKEGGEKDFTSAAFRECLPLLESLTNYGVLELVLYRVGPARRLLLQVLGHLVGAGRNLVCRLSRCLEHLSSRFL